MHEIKANLSLFKKEGSLVGFGLTAEDRYDAIVFCSDFMQKLITGNAGVYQLDTNEIAFITSSNKFVSFYLDNEDIQAMKDLFSLKRGNLDIIDCSHLSGFKLFIENHPKEYEIVPLSRVLN